MYKTYRIRHEMKYAQLIKLIKNYIKNKYLGIDGSGNSLLKKVLFYEIQLVVLG